MPVINPPGTSPSQAGSIATRSRTVVLFGDSWMEQYNNTTATGTVVQSAGTATATITSHGLKVGDVYPTNGAVDAKYNMFNMTILTVPDANTFTFAVDPTAAASDVLYVVQTEQASAKNWVGHVNAALDHRYTILLNLGRGGDDSDQMLARIAAVVALAPSEVWLNHGTNCIYKSSFTTAKIKTNDALIYATFRNAGIFVRESSIPHHVTTTTAQRQQVLEVNRWRKEYWDASGFGRYHDTYSPLVTATTGSIKSNVLYDSVHESNLGAFLIAQAIVSEIGTANPILHGGPVSQLDRWATDNSNRQLFGNPTLVAGVQTAGVLANTIGGLGGPPTGTAADLCKVDMTAGFGVASSVVCSVNARVVATDGDDYGNNQRLVITTTADGDTVTFSSNENMTARCTNGDTITMTVHVRVTSATNLRSIRLGGILQTATSGNLVIADQLWTASDPVYPAGSTFTRTLKATGKIRTPSGTHGAVSSITWTVTANFGGAGGATIDYAKATVVKAS